MTLALEINDVALVLAGDGEILAEEPGYAMLDGARPETGAAAARRARLKPLFADTRHWQDLGTLPLPRPMPAAATPAEVAYAQLAQFVRPHLGHGPDVLIAAPPWYTREQLALLLGVAQEAGLKPVGLVDAGLASASLEPAPESVLQLELGLHRATLTVLDHAGDLRRTRFEVLQQHGWLALQQAWLEMIASAFVRKTRFDPLHQAATEQRLCDGLPAWLDALRAGEAVVVEVESSDAKHAVEFAAGDFVQAAAPLYEEYVRALQRARPGGGPLYLRLSQRFSSMPGLDEHLAAIRDCEVTRLPRGAAALGALAYERVLRGNDRGLVLVQHLPVPLQAGARRAAVRTAAVPAELQAHARRAGESCLSHRSLAPHARVGRARRPPCAASRAGPRHFPQPLHAVGRGRRGVARRSQHLRHVREWRSRHRSRRVARGRPPARRQPGRGVRAHPGGGRRWRAVRSRSSASRSWT